PRTRAHATSRPWGTRPATPRSKRTRRHGMTTQHDVRTWRGRTVVDRDGDKVGKVEDVYLDRRSEEPEWLAIKTGLFGSNVSFVPVQNATMDDDTIRVAHEKDLVKDAPNI